MLPAEPRLLFFGFYRDRLEILSLENLLAVQAFHIVDTVSTGDDCCLFVLTGGSHTETWGIRNILMIHSAVSRPTSPDNQSVYREL
jgi:hypothetical protein